MSARPVNTGTSSGLPPQPSEVRRLALLLAHQEWGGQQPQELADQATRLYWSTFGRVGRPLHLHSWLRMTLRRLAMSAARGRPPAQWAADQQDETGHLVGLVLRQLASPALHVLSGEVLERALTGLRRGDRRVLQMRLVGLSADEVAKRVGASGEDVQLAYKRARRHLRTTIEADQALAAELRRHLDRRR